MLWAKLLITGIIMMPLGLLFAAIAKEAEGSSEGMYTLFKILAVLSFYVGIGIAVGSLLYGVWVA